MEPAAGDLERQILELAASVLNVRAGAISATLPLSWYGLDSVAAAELTWALQERIHRAVPDGLLFEKTSVAELAAHFAETSPRDTQALTAMLADSELPESIHPAGSPSPATPRTVLLTGATGFLGAFTLAALLRETDARVICLTRCRDTTEGARRVQTALQRYGLGSGADLDRVIAEPADLAMPELGLNRQRAAALAREAEVVCHCAGAVNWVAPYAALRAVNAVAVRELLRLACRDVAKPFVLVSSLAACYSTEAPAEIHERDETLPYLRGLHLGYAQSKCVGEALAWEAGRRGLPVTILRPALLFGDSRSGVGNTGDFLSLFFKGCIQLKCAPDLDWLMDCCPVDQVAEVVALITRTPSPGTRAFHLVSPRQRHWREGVLWLNLFGYPVRLAPYGQWLERFQEALGQPDFALRPLRGFFFHRPAGDSAPTLPELYEESRRTRARTDATVPVLARLGSYCPPLNGRLLDRYFGALIAEGFLHSARPPGQSDSPDPGALLQPAFFENALRTMPASGAARVLRVERVGESCENSILTEMTAWASRRIRGLFRCRVTLAHDDPARPLQREMMVKIKPRDTEVTSVAASVARLCDEKVGEAYRRFKDRLGFDGCHLRELAFYAQTDERIRRNTPECLGMLRDDTRELWALLLEYLPESLLAEIPLDSKGWPAEPLGAAIRGLAEIQSVWFNRWAELRHQAWLPPVLATGDLEEMTPLWRALAEFSRRDFDEWAGGDLHSIRLGLIETIGQWGWMLESLPHTLIHNDFNPRNLAFRRERGGLRLCAYDWELASWGVPQHDLAELLCFVLPTDVHRPEVLRWVEFHRHGFEKSVGQPMEAGEWLQGFRLCLYDLMVHRLPLYALVHQFRRQRFLPRLVRTWRRLYEMFPPPKTKRRSTTRERQW
jgi:thioester reductase-like protein